jgi:hypothetical protein
MQFLVVNLVATMSLTADNCKCSLYGKGVG